jgi:hypothetical protein
VLFSYFTVLKRKKSFYILLISKRDCCPTLLHCDPPTLPVSERLPVRGPPLLPRTVVYLSKLLLVCVMAATMKHLSELAHTGFASYLLHFHREMWSRYRQASVYHSTRQGLKLPLRLVKTELPSKCLLDLVNASYYLLKQLHLFFKGKKKKKS